jgi:hypothetical protein
MKSIGQVAAIVLIDVGVNLCGVFVDACDLRFVRKVDA